MEYLIYSFGGAMSLLVNPSDEMVRIIVLTFQVSLTALLLATIIGLPLGTMLVMREFRFRGAVVEGLNILGGLPPVVVGLFLFVLIAEFGPLGFMGIVHTPAAMIAAQFFLALPVVAGLTRLALVRVDPSVYVGARTLGASPWQVRRVVVYEARHGILIAVISAFMRTLSAVGAILVVGGNIKGLSRVMNTAIADEAAFGDIRLLVALGIILLYISVLSSVALYFLKKRVRYET